MSEKERLTRRNQGSEIGDSTSMIKRGETDEASGLIN
jgi:hypothetical protein